jgi:hypothetical protein
MLTIRSVAGSGALRFDLGLRWNDASASSIQRVGGSKLLLVFVAMIVVTFAALELREAHGLERARARRGRRKWSAAGPPACFAEILCPRSASHRSRLQESRNGRGR